jgi:hypothetical protein
MILCTCSQDNLFIISGQNFTIKCTVSCLYRWENNLIYILVFLFKGFFTACQLRKNVTIHELSLMCKLLLYKNRDWYKVFFALALVFSFIFVHWFPNDVWNEKSKTVHETAKNKTKQNKTKKPKLSLTPYWENKQWRLCRIEDKTRTLTLY